MNRKIVCALSLLGIFLLNYGGTGDGLLPVIGETSPVPGTGLHVLIVEDRAKRQSLPPGQFDAMMSADIDELIRAKNGTKYLYDQHQDVSIKADPWVKDAMKVPREKLPWLVLDKDGNGTSEAFPLEPREFKELLQKYIQ